MRILQIGHNHHIVGGSDKVYFETTDLLERAGHQVIPYCIASPKNLPNEWSKYFPKGAHTAQPKTWDTARYFYNFEAGKNLGRLLDACGPVDIAHLHIYHGKQTTAILHQLRKRGIPIVQTLHEYKLACPVYTLQRNDKNCELCVQGNNLRAVANRCKDRSLTRTAVMVAESYFSRLLGDVRLVDQFICVSEFQRQIMIRAGIPVHKLRTVHNFVHTECKRVHHDHDGYLLYFGRLERLKGLDTLITAVKSGGQNLIVAGSGSWKSEMTKRIENEPNIQFVGFKSGAELERLVDRAKAVVVPSEWYENCPMTVLEAKASGRPVIGARIGGIPELIQDGIDGFLFDPGNAAQLANCIEQLDDRDFSTMSKAAMQDAANRFSAVAHKSRLTEIYQHCINPGTPAMAQSATG